MLFSLSPIAHVLVVVGFVRSGRDGRGASLDAATVFLPRHLRDDHAPIKILAPTSWQDLKLIGGGRGDISGPDVPIYKRSGRGHENGECVVACGSASRQDNTKEPGNR